jgi:NADPH:quinone reductase
MRAVLIDAFGAAPSVRDVDPPTAGPGHVRVRVRASSVNPVDSAIAAGMLKDALPHEFPITLGRDYAGTVDAVGDGVTRYAPGDAVFGFVAAMTPPVHDGGWAELVVVPEDVSIAPLPAGVDLAEAGAAPLAAITALALLDAVSLAAGEVVLVVGATGGVGSAAVQLAAGSGARVVAPARDDDADYLRGLGVAELVPRDGDVVAAVRERIPEGVDALLDLVSYAPGAYDGALGEGARVASPLGAAGDGPGRTNVLAEPTTANLERVAALLASGALTVHVQHTYPLEHAAEALQDLASSHVRGKLALELP